MTHLDDPELANEILGFRRVALHQLVQSHQPRLAVLQVIVVDEELHGLRDHHTKRGEGDGVHLICVGPEGQQGGSFMTHTDSWQAAGRQLRSHNTGGW
jgi:hypothetical protein